MARAGPMSLYGWLCGRKVDNSTCSSRSRPCVPGLVDTIVMHNVFLHYVFVLPRLALKHEPCAGQLGLGYLIVQQVATGSRLAAISSCTQ